MTRLIYTSHIVAGVRSNWYIEEKNQEYEKIKRTDGAIQKLLGEVDAIDKRYMYLSKFVFYLHDINNKEVLKNLKKCLNVGGGVYVNALLQNVTHIIIDVRTTEITEELLLKLKSLNSYVYILHPGWLFECFSYKRLVKEVDFEINYW